MSEGPRPRAALGPAARTARTPAGTPQRVAQAPVGKVFTPPALARRLLGKEMERDVNVVLDPACGEGALLLAAAESQRSNSPLRLVGVDVDASALAIAKERLERVNSRAPISLELLHCDALEPDFVWPPADLIVANPPWVSLSGRQSIEIPTERLARYRTAWSALEGWPSLHGAFLERMARHVESFGSRARVLAPASICDLVGYGPTRAATLRHAALSGPPEELGEDAFPGVVEPAMLLTLEPRGRRGSSTSNPWTVIGPELAALRELLRAFPRLPVGCFSDPGVHTGNSSAELLERPRENGAGVREGRDLSPFGLRSPRLGLRDGMRPTPERRFRVAALERYARMPVLLRQTADRPMAALHESPTYFRNTLLACSPPDGLDPAFVVAILNGPVAAAWHRLNFRDARQRSFPQVKIGHLKTQPFPLMHRDASPEDHDGIARTVRALDPGSPHFEQEVANLEQRTLELFQLPPLHAERVRELAR